jgi:hypothetical protein
MEMKPLQTFAAKVRPSENEPEHEPLNAKDN